MEWVGTPGCGGSSERGRGNEAPRPQGWAAPRDRETHPNQKVDFTLKLLLMSCAVYSINLGLNSRVALSCKLLVVYGDTSGVDKGGRPGYFGSSFFKGQIWLPPGPASPSRLETYVTLSTGFWSDTSGQIAELQGTQGLTGAKHTLWTAGHMMFCPVPSKQSLNGARNCFQIKYLLARACVLLVRKHVFFCCCCFKIRFPWKEQWQNQRRQVFGGAETNQMPLPWMS